ncbi:unnamed protein product [Adineta ricciae]|uniref:Uncharacterized protein n=1 Tax=Adineta ricciae TaxID=249248 RepID=A0A815GK36_ADIRI|nr:unnamed protein product [Adineta ricciae]CAF1339456.1 unnamed protein product [Adineta ricciae]
MKLWWCSAANILYAIGSLGYLAVNIVNLIDRTTVESSATYIVLVLLAILFVIDALLYTADWFEQRATKKCRELFACTLNIVGSVLYLVGATVFKNKTGSTNNFTNATDIPAFVFNIVGMLAFLGESILSFFAPRVTKKPSKCSVEFFAHLLNFLGNLTYLCAHVVQPIISFLASHTTQYLNKLTDIIFIIIRPIQIGGDIIYVIDAILYIIVWLKANEQMRKVGMAWIERGHATINKRIDKPKSNLTNANRLLNVEGTAARPEMKKPIVKPKPQVVVITKTYSSNDRLCVETIG